MKQFWLAIFLIILIACQPVTLVPTTTKQVEVTPASSPAVPIEYELKQPDATDLLVMIDSVLTMEEELTYSNDVLGLIVEQEPGSIHHFIGSDFERYYLDGFPDADNLVKKVLRPWEVHSFAALESIGPVLQISLLQYINNNQGTFEDNSPLGFPNITLRTYSMDIDGDGNLEWLIGEKYQEYNLENWFLINKQQDGQYHFIKSFDFGWPGVWNSGTEIVMDDLTGDGNDEIIRISYSYIAGRDTGSIDVYTWDGYQISLIDEIYLPGTPPPYGEISEYVIEDFNEDGVAEIRVDSPQFRRFDCQWVKSSIYYFDKHEPNVEVFGEEIPETDKCLIARALESDFLSEQISLYQEAISKFSTETSSYDELAWLRLQLAMAYASDDDDKNASAQLELLLTMDGDGEFLAFVKSKFDLSLSPILYCDVLYSATLSEFWGESIGSDIDINLTHYAYPVDYSPVADLVCPFPKVLRNRLENLKIPRSDSPIDVLESLGYPFEWTQHLDLGENITPKWLGVLQFDLPVLVYIDGDEYWEIEMFTLYSTSNPSNFEMAVYRPKNSVETQIFLLFDADGKYCGLPDIEKQLVSITLDSHEYDRWFICDSDQYSLESDADIEYTLGKFSGPYSNSYEEIKAPDWFYLPEYIEDTGQQKTVLALISELERATLSQTDTKIVADGISNLMESLPAGDPAAQLLLARLHYILGFNYELSGQEESAVDIYLSLIEKYPQSLWSQYAKIRIQPVK